MYQGGDGLRRDLMLLVPARVVLLCERRTSGPSGAQGGKAGTPGENVLICDGVEKHLPGKTSFTIQAGDIISIRSPGGGGWGAIPEESRHES